MPASATKLPAAATRLTAQRREGTGRGINKDWTQADIAQLLALKRAGKCAREIGVMMRRTRNSIIGKLLRLGLAKERQGRKPKVAAPRPVRPKAPAPEKPKKLKRVLHFGALPKEEKEAPGLRDIVAEPGGVPLLSAGAFSCRWEMQPRADGSRMICGAPVRFKSYCACHVLRVYANGAKLLQPQACETVVA